MNDHSKNKTTAASFFYDLLNERRYERIPDIFTEDCLINNSLRGHQGVETWLRSFHDIFPDCFDTIRSQWAEGDQVVSQIWFEGTHKGKWMGYPATGQRCAWPGIAIHTIRDGKIAVKETVIEQTKVFRQIGWLKPIDGS